MRKLKPFASNADGLRRFYCTNLRTVFVTHSSPAWYMDLSVQSRYKSESIQRLVTKMIYVKLNHDQNFISLSYVSDLILDASFKYFSKILDNHRHLIIELFLILTAHQQRKSTFCLPELWRTKAVVVVSLSWWHNVTASDYKTTCV